MTIPGTAPLAVGTMDPSEVLDFVVDLAPLLEPGEAFNAITFSVLPESVLLGFQIMDQAPYAPEEFEPSRIRLWLTIAEAERSAARWDGGANGAFEFNATTDSTPPRKFQRTVQIKVIQK